MLLKLQDDSQGLMSLGSEVGSIGSPTVVDAVLVAFLRKIVTMASVSDVSTAARRGIGNQVREAAGI